MSESDRPPGSGLEAFDAVYEREFSYVWRTLGRLGVAPADLADAAHDVFVVLFRRWDEVDHARDLRPWLFGVARRVASTARRRPPDAPTDDVDRAPDDDGGDRDQLALRDLLWRALATLAPERHEVVVLHDLEGHTGAEIARILDVPVNTVHSRLRLAREDLVAAIRRLGGAR